MGWAVVGTQRLLEKEAVAGLPSQNSPKTTISWFEGARPREGADCTTSKSLGSHPKLSSFWPWCRCFRLQTGWQQQCSQKESDHTVQPAWASSYICHSWYSHSHTGMWTQVLEEISFHGAAGFSGVSSAHSERQSTQNISFWGEMSGLVGNRRGYLPHYFNTFKVAS